MSDSYNIKNDSDAELILRFKNLRDNTIIGELFQRYTHLVFGVCMKYLKNEDEAKDGVMQIFEKLISDLHRHNIDNFKGWLYMVAKNHCLMYLRSRKVHIELPPHLTGSFADSYSDDAIQHKNEEGIPVELSSSVHHNGEDKEKQLALMEFAIKKLKEEQKKCIEFFYLQEKSYEEVAQLTGYTMKEVKSYIQNGKRNLRIIMTAKNSEVKS